VPALSRLNIRWEKIITADQSIEIFDQNGNLVQQEILSVKQKASRHSIMLNQLVAGMYVVKITDSKSHITSSQQFIIN
jgi:hypothetical protein